MMHLPNEMLTMIGQVMTLPTLIRSRQTSRTWRLIFNPILTKRLAELSYRLMVIYSIEAPTVTAYITIGWCSKLIVTPPHNHAIIHVKDTLDETWADRLAKGRLMISWINTSHPPYLTPIIDDAGTISAILLEVNLEEADSSESILGKRHRDEYEYEGYPDDLSSDI